MSHYCEDLNEYHKQKLIDMLLRDVVLLRCVVFVAATVGFGLYLLKGDGFSDPLNINLGL